MLAANRQRISHKSLSKKSSKRLTVYKFPLVQGLEDVTQKMGEIKTENLFCALLKGYDLAPIENEKQAKQAERWLEYLLRAFDKAMPSDVKIYIHLLEFLCQEYDSKHLIPVTKGLKPDVLVKELLKEEGLEQKALVPFLFQECQSAF